MSEVSRKNEKPLVPPSGQMEKKSWPRGQSTVAAHELYKSQKFGGASCLTAGDMVHFRKATNP